MPSPPPFFFLTPRLCRVVPVALCLAPPPFSNTEALCLFGRVLMSVILWLGTAENPSLSPVEQLWGVLSLFVTVYSAPSLHLCRYPTPVDVAPSLGDGVWSLLSDNLWGALHARKPAVVIPSHIRLRHHVKQREHSIFSAHARALTVACGTFSCNCARYKLHHVVPFPCQLKCNSH
jgi:hypothetical protein